jgi:Tol biopolymer transport system component
MKRLALTIAVPTAVCTLLLMAAPADATYPDRNGRIAFAADNGSGFEVYSDFPDGTGLTQLTNISGTDNATPDWSPDGTLIAFADVQGHRCSVYVMQSDGTGLSDLTGGHKGCEGYPAFTTSGHRLLFTLQRCRGCPVWISTMNLHGGNRRRIISSRRVRTRAPVAFVGPAMSPDGRTVAFAANCDKVSFRKAVFTVRMNGSHLTEIVPFRLDVSSKLDWSPNGERLLYTPYIDFPNGHVPNVFTIRPDASRLHQLTYASGDTAAISGSYSPNGRWIVYRRETPNGYSQWKMHPKGTDKTRIRRLSIAPRSQDWGPKPS